MVQYMFHIKTVTDDSIHCHNLYTSVTILPTINSYGCSVRISVMLIGKIMVMLWITLFVEVSVFFPT